MTALRGIPTDFGYAPAREARLASRHALERALATTCALAAALFAACWLASGLVPSRPLAIPIVPSAGTDHELMDFKAVPPDAPQASPPSRLEPAVPEPVPDEQVVVPFERVAPVPGRGGPAVLPGRPGPVGDAGAPGPLGEVTPEPGVFVPVEQLPEVVLRVAPEYPELAREAHVEGTVHLWALVGLDGSVDQVRVLRSVPLLDAAAAEALARWRFTPALNNGRPVRVWVAVPVRFTLR